MRSSLRCDEPPPSWGSSVDRGHRGHARATRLNGAVFGSPSCYPSEMRVSDGKENGVVTRR